MFDKLCKQVPGENGRRVYQDEPIRGIVLSLQPDVLYTGVCAFHLHSNNTRFTVVDPQNQLPAGIVPMCTHPGCTRHLERKGLDPYRMVQGLRGLCDFVRIMRYKGAKECLDQGHLGKFDTVLVTDQDVWSQFDDPDVLDIRYMISIYERTAVTMDVRLHIQRLSGMSGTWRGEYTRMYESAKELHALARVLYHRQKKDFPVLQPVLIDPPEASFIPAAGYHVVHHKTIGKMATYFFRRYQAFLHTMAMQGIPCECGCGDGSYKCCAMIKRNGQAPFTGQYTIVNNATRQVVTSVLNISESLQHIGGAFQGYAARRARFLADGYVPWGLDMYGNPFTTFPEHVRAMTVDDPDKEV